MSSSLAFEKVAECLYRNPSSKAYYALVKIKGKQFKKSLKTIDLAEAKCKLRGYRAELEEMAPKSNGKATVRDICQKYVQTIQDQAESTLLTVTQSNTFANVAYTHDGLSRQVSETSGGLTHAYTYDLAGNRIKTLFGGTGRTLISTYDVLNRLSTMNESGLTTTYAYDLNGNIVQKSLPNGDKIQSVFDSLNRTSTLSGRTGGNAALYTFA